MVHLTWHMVCMEGVAWHGIGRHDHVLCGLAMVWWGMPCRTIPLPRHGTVSCLRLRAIPSHGRGVQCWCHGMPCHAM